jgi:hypothetical protein
MLSRNEKFCLVMFSVLIFLFSFAGCTSNQSKDPVVKPSDKNAVEEKKEIVPHDSKAITENMPIHGTVTESGAGESPEGSISPITIQLSLSILLNSFSTNESLRENYKETQPWIEELKRNQRFNASFHIGSEKQLKYVIILGNRIIDANFIGENYADQFKELDVNEMILFLFVDKNDPTKLDFSSSYLGLRIPNPDMRVVEKAQSYHGLMYNKDDLFVLRGATVTPEEQFQQRRYPDTRKETNPDTPTSNDGENSENS